jgi:transposase InsO family protein
MQAVELVRRGWRIREAARYIGVYPSTVLRWVRRCPPWECRAIATCSSRPHHHPRQLPDELVGAILRYRQEQGRCAEVLHHLLVRDGYRLSLSSVKRVLHRHGASRFSRWKKWHRYPPRPLPAAPGLLVELDTIHDGAHADRLYVYALLDVCSRFAHAWPSGRITTHRSLRFVEQAQRISPFRFQTIQSDHGPEFSKWFTKRIVERGMAHRHSRIRQPNDNGHVERFIRTLREECLSRIRRNLAAWRREIPEYLAYYNAERPHMGLNMQTPSEVLRSY